jgi:hypothetical protein
MRTRSGMDFDTSMPVGITHYTRELADIPPCGNRTGNVTTAFWDVTCDPCLHSLPLTADQFQQAYRQLAAALLRSLRPSRTRS